MQKGQRKSDELAHWEGFQKGDKSSFLELYDTNYEVLFVYAQKIAKDKQLAEDCIHDTFLDLWEKRGKLGHVKNLRAYLFTCTRNIVLQKLKKSKLENTTGDVGDFLFGLEFSYEDLLIKEQAFEQTKKQLENAVNELTNRQKEIIFLRFNNGLSYDEIAEITSLSIRRVYNVVHEALLVLRKNLKK
ncbi:sigma-70 family RNA polymerase sigma factor [Flammeovirgaceae bacterium SG7u.111]|nr:sigma-70 family RNA polymerase sigma factor [Flammeovirgaceae bacterium SG7u.132]WPO36334.1 sigma-70 family RNA polymerase sigma factor [Flammeovirgaceae bacterium SG7u.111]